MTELLPHINASLNAVAAILLVCGVVLIKRGREKAHRRVMLASFCVSTLFLASYLTYHWQVGHKRFPTYPPVVVQWFYKGMLLTHIVLAVFVPILAITTIVLGYRDFRVAHRRWARWTFPIWLYVSVTGVLVYLMMYQLYPPEVPTSSIDVHERSRRQIDGDLQVTRTIETIRIYQS